MSHMGLMPERAFEQVIPKIEAFLKEKKLVSDRMLLRYRMETNGVFLLKLFDTHWLREHRLARWQLVQMPGCCGVCISTDAMVMSDYRRKGLGSFMNEIRCELAKLMGYGRIVCTVQDSNEHQLKILRGNGWSDATPWFRNPKTGNTIVTFHRDLV
jgi:hypothetical protein